MLLVRLLLAPYIGRESPFQSPFLLFLIAVMLSALYGGFGPGLLATILSALVADYFFLAPVGSIFYGDIGHHIQLILFVLEGSVITSLFVSRKRVEHRLWAAHQALEERVRERTRELSEANASLTEQVAERERIEEARYASNNILRAIIEGTTDAIYMKDLDGCYLTINSAGAAVLGKPFEEIIGQDDMELYSPDTARLLMECDRRIIASGRTQTFEVTATSAAGITRTYLLTEGVYTNPQGNVAGLIGISRDITERKQIEVELAEARDAALESARLKSEFLANMSHEIRTPMNGIIGLTGLLLNTELTPKQRQFAQDIQSSGDALLTIINDILDFSKIEAGKLKFESLDFDLHATLEGAIKSFTERAEDKGLELASLVYRDVPTKLRGDPLRVRQVLTNLIGNAVKFTKHGEVVLRVTKEYETGTHAIVRFVVSDTGIGISAAAQRRLFQAFTQADGSTTRKYGGTGLGLVISKQLVEYMDGEIGVESVEGRGSTFWFTAKFEKQFDELEPLKSISKEQHGYQPSQSSSVPTSQHTAERRRDLRILVAEDQLINQRVALHQLQELGYQADAVANGQEVLEALKKSAYDIILMDCQMPEMDGYETTAEIRQREGASKHIPIIALTAHASEEVRQKCLAAGMDDYVAKPVKSKTLEKVLEHWIARPVRPARAGAQNPSAQDSSPLERIVAPEVLASFREAQSEGETELMTELIQIYLRDTRPLLARLESAFEQGNAPVVQREAHGLKGTSAILGITRMAVLSGELENDVINGSLEEARSLMIELKQEFKCLDEAFGFERTERSPSENQDAPPVE